MMNVRTGNGERTFSVTGWWFGCDVLFSQKYWESHHPNGRTHIFQRVAQPPTRSIPWNKTVLSIVVFLSHPFRLDHKGSGMSQGPSRLEFFVEFACKSSNHCGNCLSCVETYIIYIYTYIIHIYIYIRIIYIILYIYIYTYIYIYINISDFPLTAVLPCIRCCFSL